MSHKNGLFKSAKKKKKKKKIDESWYIHLKLTLYIS